MMEHVWYIVFVLNCPIYEICIVSMLLYLADQSCGPLISQFGAYVCVQQFCPKGLIMQMPVVMPFTWVRCWCSSLWQWVWSLWDQLINVYAIENALMLDGFLHPSLIGVVCMYCCCNNATHQSPQCLYLAAIAHVEVSPVLWYNESQQQNIIL